MFYSFHIIAEPIRPCHDEEQQQSRGDWELPALKREHTCTKCNILPKSMISANESGSLALSPLAFSRI